MIHRKIRFGDSGEHVERYQRALIKLGYKLPKYGADGIYGSETHEATIAFCGENGQSVVLPDRVTGPQVMAAVGLADSMEEIESGHHPCRAGNGAFLWRADLASVSEWVDLASELKLARVMPKIMNKHGRPMYQRIMENLIPALQDHGIEVVPWAYLDDQGGREDAEKLVELCQGYGVDGAVANMEKEIVDDGSPKGRKHDAEQVDQVLTVLTGNLGFVGFSSFRRYDYHRFPKDVLRKHDSVTMMVQCYNEKTPAQSRKRVKKSAESWLKDEGLEKVRMTLGCFPVAASQSGKFGSRPDGMESGRDQIRRMAEDEPRLDPHVDWWALDFLRHDYEHTNNDFRRVVAGD